MGRYFRFKLLKKAIDSFYISSLSGCCCIEVVGNKKMLFGASERNQLLKSLLGFVEPFPLGRHFALIERSDEPCTEPGVFQAGL